MGYKNMLGLVSTVNSIVKYSEEDRSWQIFTSRKNGKSKLTFRRNAETIPMTDITEFTTYAHGKQKNRGGYATALVGTAMFGAAGAVAGTMIGRREVGAVNEIGFAFRTKSGDVYEVATYISVKVIPVEKSEAQIAFDKLQKISAVFTDSGTPYNDEWRQQLSTFKE